MKTDNRKSVLKFVGLFLVGLTVFLLVFGIVGFGEIVTALGQIRPYLYGIGILLIILNIVAWSSRWHLFVKLTHPEISGFDLFKNMLVGLAINNLTPIFKMGGEAARVYLLKVRHGIRGREGLATITSDLTIEFIVDVIFAMMSFLFLMIFFRPPVWLYGILAVFVAVCSLLVFGIFGLYTGQKIIYKIIGFICKKMKRFEGYEERLYQKYETFQKTFQKIMKNRRVFAGALTLTLLRKVLTVTTYVVIFAALGHTTNIVNIIIAVGIGYMLMVIPATPGSLGIFEGGMISVFVLLGVPAEIAASVVFLDRLIWFWGVTGTGSMVGTYYGLDLIIDRKIIESYSTAGKDI